MGFSGIMTQSICCQIWHLESSHCNQQIPTLVIQSILRNAEKSDQIYKELRCIPDNSLQIKL